LPPLGAVISKDFFLVNIGSDDEMIQQIMEDEKGFDTNGAPFF
jgi:hypothetical protein